MSKYFPPEYQKSAFHCAHCDVYAEQLWEFYCETDYGYIEQDGELRSGNKTVGTFSLCSHCKQLTFWISQKIAYPTTRMFSLPNSDLPDEVREVYEEAANVANHSPRAACALLRLAVEMLLKHLGETGSINQSIGNLVKKGLDVRIQQSLDIVRVTGNEAVHPGVIDFSDETDVAVLFELINVIAESLISLDRRIQSHYNNLPEKAREGIEKRDGKTK